MLQVRRQNRQSSVFADNVNPINSRLNYYEYAIRCLDPDGEIVTRVNFKHRGTAFYEQLKIVKRGRFELES